MSSLTRFQRDFATVALFLIGVALVGTAVFAMWRDIDIPGFVETGLFGCITSIAAIANSRTADTPPTPPTGMPPESRIG